MHSNFIILTGGPRTALSIILFRVIRVAIVLPCTIGRHKNDLLQRGGSTQSSMPTIVW